MIYSLLEMTVLFAFDEQKEHVLLIMKNHPPSLAGKLNGIGGKVEPGESPLQATLREAKEEANLSLTPHDVQQFAAYWGMQDKQKPYVLHSFRSFTDLNNWESKTDERVDIWNIETALQNEHLLPDLKWLLLLAKDSRIEMVSIKENL